MSITISNDRFELFIEKTISRTQGHEDEGEEFIALNESWWALFALYDTFYDGPERARVKESMDSIEKRMKELC